MNIFDWSTPGINPAGRPVYVGGMSSTDHGGLLGAMNNPLLGLAAGLLSGRDPGGTFASGLNQGLVNMQGMQHAALQGSLLKSKLDEIEQAKKEREQWAATVGQAGTAPSQYQMSDAELFPGEQQIPGLLNAGTEGTGLYKDDPQMAGLLSMLGPEQGRQFMAQAALQNMKPAELPNEIQEMLYYKDHPELFNMAQQLKRAGATSVSVGMDKPLSVEDLGKIVMPDGSRPPIGATGAQIAAAGGVVDPKLTESQSNATAFGLRASEMDKTIDDMMTPKITGGGQPKAEYDPTGYGAAKDWMTAGGSLTNWASDPKGQKFINAGRNFVAAVLRKESGATITDTEWESGKQLYIPLPGDRPEVLSQKKENRRLAVKALKIQAGPGSHELPASQPQSGPTTYKFDANGNPIQ